MRSQLQRDESATLAERPRTDQPLVRTSQLSVAPIIVTFGERYINLEAKQEIDSIFAGF
jgi:hypothetical protein